MEARMNRHFAYLVEDPARDFMQKVALSPEPPWRTATGFEKFAAQLDRDIGILKTAAMASSDEMAMSRRANAYVDNILMELEPDQFGEAFDKVAAAAIQTDIHRAQVELEKIAGPVPWIRNELNALGVELVKIALLEKEAIRGLFRPGALGLAKGRAAGAYGAVQEAARGLQSRATAPFREAASRYRQWRIGRGTEKIRRLRGEAVRSEARGAAGDTARAASLRQSQMAEQDKLRQLMRDPKYRAASLARNQRKPFLSPVSKTTAGRGTTLRETPYEQRRAIKAQGQKVRRKAAKKGTLRNPDNPDPTMRQGPAMSKKERKAWDKGVEKRRRQQREQAQAQTQQRRQQVEAGQQQAQQQAQQAAEGGSRRRRRDQPLQASVGEQQAARGQLPPAAQAQGGAASQPAAQEAAQAAGGGRGGRRGRGRRRRNEEGGRRGRRRDRDEPKLSKKEKKRQKQDPAFFDDVRYALGGKYKNLSEKQKANLWEKGLMGLGGYRLVTGSGAISGGEGIV